jgi:hypothetical protein
LFSQNYEDRESRWFRSWLFCSVRDPWLLTFDIVPDLQIRTTALDYGSGSETCSFLQWLSRWKQKSVFSPNFFCFLNEVTFAAVFKDR